MRSRAAAGILEDAGLSQVVSMEGGIKAWQGMVAHGGPEAGMAHFGPAEKIEDIVMLAWALEEGSRRFYAVMAERFSGDADAREIFADLVAAEQQHKSHLLDAYRGLTGRSPDLVAARAKFDAPLAGEIMEGGVRVAEALAWAEGQGLVEVLELAMSLEINSYDLYIKMGRRVKDDTPRQIFRSLSVEEQDHLRRLSELLDQHLT